jgi:menaquinone-dependent protoporphyrinogen oxidase
METPVLVAYGSKYGATAEIAEKIGKVLREAGLGADVQPADQVHNLTSYKGIVLGSAVYIGQWQKNAASFLKSNEKELAKRPVWLFSSGPTEEGDPATLMEGWRVPKGLQPIADRIHPRDIAIFHGVNNPEKMKGLDKWMMKNVKAPIGDFRAWDAIISWAANIANELKG